MIAFLGSVFSPYYAWARARSPDTDALNHCACNVALYGAAGKRWAMTERGAHQVRRDAASLQIGPSSLFWDGTTLTLQLDEVTAPWPSRIRGRVKLSPAAVMGTVYALDGVGRHRWHPIAPCARVEVELSHPDLRWCGSGYFDTNQGDTPLERDFERWDWSRAALSGGRTAVLYDVTRRAAPPLSLALAFDPSGAVQAFEAPPASALPRARWWVERGTRSDAGHPARVTQTLEDAPFYARSLVAAQLLGEPVAAVHESLSLDRFSAAWVRMLLPFRMPRRA